MHILILPSWYRTEEYPFGGIFFREQAQALKRAGHQIGVIAPKLWPIKRFTEDFGRFYHKIARQNDGGISTYTHYGCAWLPFVPLGNAFLWVYSGLRLFRNYISDIGQPDILHAHCALYGGVLAARIRRRYGIPFVITEHSTAYARNLIQPRKARLARKAFRQADGRVFVSPSLGMLLEKTFGKAVCPWHWIPNLLSSRFCNVQLNVAPVHTQGDFIFSNIASMAEHKGQRDLLLAFAKTFKGDGNTRLHIGGEGPMRKDLLVLASDLGISQQVRFLGTLNREEVLNEMLKADVFVLSSHYETFGVVLIEALACGKPIIATACGGPECIVNDRNGVLVSPGNIKELAHAMLHVKQHIADYDSQYIRHDCLSRFGEDPVVKQLSDLYQRVLNRTWQDPF